MDGFFIFLVVAAVVILILSCIRIVPQATEFVVEFLGKYKATWGAGIHFKIPILERVSNRITLKEQVLDSPPQPVITKDNVTMQIDTVVFFRIFDSKMYSYGVVNPVNALSNLTATTLRNIIGEMDLDSTLTSRDTINGKLTGILDDATDQWGIKITRVELKNIIPPAAIQAAMEKQMKAERDRRETLLQAEGHKEASITRAEGDKRAMILAAEGERDARIARAEGEARAIYLAKKAEADGLRALMEAGINDVVLELKKYEALTNVANGRAAKLIMPSDVVDTVKKNVIFSETSGLGHQTESEPAPEEEAKLDACCDENYKEPWEQA